MKDKINRLLLIFISISLFLLIFNFLIPLKFIQDCINNIVFFPKKILYQEKTKPSFVNSEIDKIKAENTRLLQEMNNYEVLKKDNEALKSQFQTSLLKSQNLLPAKIVGFEGFFSNPTTFVVDQGSRGGVKKGMAVILENNLVGKVDQVLPSYSKIILINNTKFSTVALDQQTGAGGVLHGEGDFILLDSVIITDSLKNGDIIATKGELESTGIGVPSDIIVGKISSINKSDSESFQTAKIEPLLNFSKLSTVFVVVN